MRLMICRRYPAFIIVGALLDEVEMRLQVPHAFGHGLVFVNLNFKGVLGPCGKAGERDYENAPPCDADHPPAFHHTPANISNWNPTHADHKTSSRPGSWHDGLP